MSIRSFLGGLLIIAGCSVMMLSTAAMLLSMQMQGGSGLAIGLASLAGGVAALVLGGAVLLYQR